MATIALSLCSCEEEYDKSSLIDGFESRLVIHSYFSSETPWLVKVSASGNRIDANNNIQAITNARVEIFNEEGQPPFELFHTEDGNYSRKNYWPSAGQKYTIRVEADNYPDVVARSYVPAKSQVEVKDFKVIEVGKEKGVEVDFKISDDSKIESFYLWQVIQLEEGAETEENQSQSGFADDFLGELENEESSQQEIIDSHVFEDGSYSTKISSLGTSRFGGDSNNIFVEGIVSSGDDLIKQTVINISENEIDETILDGDTRKDNKYELRVLSISKELYEFYNSVESYRAYGESNSTVETPFIFYSNVHNGLGVFAGMSETKEQF